MADVIVILLGVAIAGYLMMGCLFWQAFRWSPYHDSQWTDILLWPWRLPDD